MRRDTYMSIERHHVNEHTVHSEHTFLTIISVFNPKYTQTNLNAGTNLLAALTLSHSFSRFAQSLVNLSIRVEPLLAA